MTHVVFLVHGIGRHANGVVGRASVAAFTEQVQSELLAAASAYPGFDPARLVLQPVLYDDVFVSHVTRWDALASSLSSTPFASLTDWMRGASDPDFLWDSIGDVILYRAFAEAQQHVITRVASQMVAAVEHYGPQADYSIVAHSLGTAVAHDTVQKLATTAIDGNRVMQPPNFRFRNFFALANVSRLVWATDPDFYEKTRVRPRDSGLLAEQCAVEYYASFRHIADPVPSIVRFAPRGWSAGAVANVEIAHLRDANVHAYTHYLQNPRCADLILARVLGSQVVPVEARRARIAAFTDHVGAGAPQEQLAVRAIASALDAASAQSAGTFDQAVKATGDLLGHYKRELGRLFP